MPNYSASSEAFELIDGHILRASCRNEAGEYVQSELDLAQFIGNSDGMFAAFQSRAYTPRPFPIHILASSV